jgi:hypothetical protein
MSTTAGPNQLESQSRETRVDNKQATASQQVVIGQRVGFSTSWTS